MKDKRFKFIVLKGLILELVYTLKEVYQHVIFKEIGSGPYKIAKDSLCIIAFGEILNFNKNENKV
jgi:hypothetical protein